MWHADATSGQGRCVDGGGTPPIPHGVRVHPRPLSGRLRVPGDKSLSHRALLLGALAGVPVRVRGVATSGDVAATAAALGTLGAHVELAPDPDDGQLAGTVAGPLHEATDVLDCVNSGTSMRLLAGVATGLDGLTVLTGDTSLRRRPMERVAVPLRRMGATVDGRDGGRLPPLAVRGGPVAGIEYDSPVASAQVKSAVLLAGLRADAPTRVRSPLPSRDHTERLLTFLGLDVERWVGHDGTETVVLHPGPLHPRPLEVPGDPSSAAFWLVAGATGGGPVAVEGLTVNPERSGAVEILRQLGAEVDVAAEGDTCGEPTGDVEVSAGQRRSAEIAGRTVVAALDELPVLALAGAVAGGLTVTDAAELRVKESDRIAALHATFGALGLELEPAPDGFHVPGGQRPRGGTVQAHDDHRIAMLACIAGTIASEPVEVHGMQVVATSYPGFLRDLAHLGGLVEALDADASSVDRGASP